MLSISPYAAAETCLRLLNLCLNVTLLLCNDGCRTHTTHKAFLGIAACHVRLLPGPEIPPSWRRSIDLVAFGIEGASLPPGCGLVADIPRKNGIQVGTAGIRTVGDSIRFGTTTR